MNLITPTEMHVDDVDSGLPLLTLDASGMGGPGPITYALSPDAVRRLVDSLIGVAPAAPGECRVVVKFAVEDLGRGLNAMPSLRSTPSKNDAPDPA